MGILISAEGRAAETAEAPPEGANPSVSYHQFVREYTALLDELASPEKEPIKPIEREVVAWAHLSSSQLIEKIGSAIDGRRVYGRGKIVEVAPVFGGEIVRLDPGEMEWDESHWHSPPSVALRFQVSPKARRTNPPSSINLKSVVWIDLDYENYTRISQLPVGSEVSFEAEFSANMKRGSQSGEWNATLWVAMSGTVVGKRAYAMSLRGTATAAKPVDVTEVDPADAEERSQMVATPTMASRPEVANAPPSDAPEQIAAGDPAELYAALGKIERFALPIGFNKGLSGEWFGPWREISGQTGELFSASSVELVLESMGKAVGLAYVAAVPSNSPGREKLVSLLGAPVNVRPVERDEAINGATEWLVYEKFVFGIAEEKIVEVLIRKL